MESNKFAIIAGLLAIFILGVFILPAKNIPAMKVNRDLADSVTNVTYTCPMHPEITSDTPGQCPKCGMDLVPKKDEKEQGMECSDREKCKSGGCNMECCKGNSGGCMENCPTMMKEHQQYKSNEHNHKSGCKKGCC